MASLATRIKEYYEGPVRIRLMHRTPVVIRISGHAFHEFTKGFDKPFDHILMRCMDETMKHMCENVPNTVLGYTYSDEITLILNDYKSSRDWFNYDVQKICSVAASMATLQFNKVFANYVVSMPDNYGDYCQPNYLEDAADYNRYLVTLLNAVDVGARFNCKCFNIPYPEVLNLIRWKQSSASNYSIHVASSIYFEPDEYRGKTYKELQEMLYQVLDIDWSEYSIREKYGACCVRGTDNEWYVDDNIPIFNGEGAEYVKKLLKEE